MTSPLAPSSAVLVVHLRAVVAATLALLLVGCGSAPAVRASNPATTALAPAERPSVAPSQPLALRRGLNLGDALDAPNEGDWGVVLAASDFAAVKQAGFDHVRLPVRFSAHAAAAAPYAIQPDFLARVDWAIDQALANGLAIVVDLHHYAELMAAPDEHRARMVGLWRQIAERERARPPSVAFELCNEPTDKVNPAKWNAIQAEALAVVRLSNPTRTVVLEGVFWASAQSLRDTLLIPTGDPYVVGSFHMYQPILFTHQGASFMPPEYETRGILFPGPPPAPLTPAASSLGQAWVRDWFQRYNEAPPERNPSGPAIIADQLDMAKDFADRTHLPVYMGEFGCIDNADPRSRETWTRMTRKEAERRGFGWAYWDDGGAFRIFDRRSGSWNPGLKGSLFD
jgi:endoglucanase